MLDPAALGDHLDRLYRAAWALCGSREDAEDLVQDTYARVLAQARACCATTTTSATCCGSCATRSSAATARAARRPVTTPLPEDVRAGRPRARLAARGGARRREVFAAIAALPDDFRDALVAVDVAGPLLRARRPSCWAPKEATITSRLLSRAGAGRPRGKESPREGVL